MHRPALPYKFKFKFSGCGNDCVNAIHRADFAVIGTWRDDMKVNQDEVKAYVARVGRKYTIDQVITRCPTRALSLNDDDTLDVDNKSCVRCMHCLNVMTKALAPGDDRGASILIGGKRALKVGDLMGIDDDALHQARNRRGFRKAGRLRRASCSTSSPTTRWSTSASARRIDRIGLPAFLEAIGIDPDPNMVNHPRTSCYVRTDDFTDEAEKYFERKAREAGLNVAAD